MLSSLKSALNHYRENASQHIDYLKDFTRIPSVSFPGFPPEEVERSAIFVQELMDKAGLENTQILKLEGTHPYVYGEWIHQPDAPTVLLYAHHDVQPPLRESVWKTPPFEPTQVGDRLFARGIADDKAGVMIHIASIEAYLKTSGHLPVNVKVIVEGEEEIGSEHLAQFLEKYGSLLKADTMVLTDCTNYDTGIPSLTTSLRGLVSMDITVSAMDHPLHSGMWGGPIPDPAMGLSKMLSGLVDAKGRIALDDLWKEVTPPTPEEVEAYRSLNMDATLFRKQSGLHPTTHLFSDQEQLLLQIWREPSLVINSIEVGGKKIAGNVLMDSAWARIGLRLVPDMDPQKCATILKDYLKEHCPWGLELTIEEEAGVAAWKTTPTHPIFKVAADSLSKGYGKPTVFIGCGGTIPFVAPLSDKLGITPALLVGIEDPYTNAHSENESLCLSDFHKAANSQIYFFNDLSDEN